MQTEPKQMDALALAFLGDAVYELYIREHVLARGLVRADRLHKVRRYEVITSFCRAIEDGGYPVGVYSGQNYFKNHVAFHTFSDNPVWLASYTRYNRLPEFPYKYDMWQFTDRAVVAGIRGLVDLSAVWE